MLADISGFTKLAERLSKTKLRGAISAGSGSATGAGSGSFGFGFGAAAGFGRSVAVVGLLQPRAPTAGRLAAFVDTECLDSTWRLQQPKMEAAAGQACWWLLRLLLD